MLRNAKFITNTKMKVEDRDSWRNMGFNDRSKLLPDKGGIPNFRKKLYIQKSVKCATVTVTALGIFDLYLNDKRVGDYDNDRAVFDELKPGWTDYNSRVFGYTYNIGNLLRTGENILLCEVSCGWWACRISFGIYGFKTPAFCCELKIEYEDGETETVVTDETWETALCGPVKTADIWDGEYFDARCSRGECDSWESAAVMTEYRGKTVRASAPRIIVRKELERKPLEAIVYQGVKDNGSTFGEINVILRKNGEGCERTLLTRGQNIVLDMGQNTVGRPHITLKAARGTKITCYFAELLNDSGEQARGNDGPKGSCYIKNYRSALSRMVYVSSGESIEDYAPKHTFFGYRYIEIETDGDIELISVRGEVVGSDNRETCEFSCSDEEVNKLWSNIVWGQRGNYLSIPTDCPQRDERLGWTGDTQIFCGAGSYIADIYEFMRKWLQDARDTQGEDGSYCDVIPKVFTNPKFIGNAAWTDACIIVPYRMYLKYGNAQIIEEHFDSMERYMDYISTFGLEGANTAYGDWLSYEQTDKRYIAVCYYAYTADIMMKCSKLLNRKDRERHYAELHERIKKHFTDRYVDENGITERTQTGYLLALKFDLVPNSMRKSYVNKLRDMIVENDYTLSTGFVGTGILCTTLSEVGLHDICYSLLLQTKDPSWLYSVRQGATTVWERWNSYTLENGFGDVNMNSFNHYSYGAVAEWMVAYMVGIREDENAPGFDRIIISPKVDARSVLPVGQKRIEYASAKYDSSGGRIESSWHVEKDGFTYEFTVPRPATAEIQLNGKTKLVIDGKEYEAEAIGTVSDDTVSFELGAGKHIVRC